MLEHQRAGNAVAVSGTGPALDGSRTIPALDGVRGIAILLVLMHQLILDLPGSDPWVGRLMVPLEAGWVGVQLFFVLSGFLITGILLDTRDAENYWSSFFMRRALRIFPPYYLLLMGVFVIVPAFSPVTAIPPASHQHQLWYWLYVSNWRALVGGGAYGGVAALGSCWSLAVEEQFYLVWPFVVRALRPAALLKLCLGIAVAALLLRVGMVFGAVDREIIYENTLARADALALGAVTALVLRQEDWLVRVRAHLRSASWALSGGLLCVFLASGGLARRNALSLTLGDSIVAALSALVILRATLGSTGPRTGILTRPWLRLFGQRSYFIYLFHLPLHLFASHRLLAALPQGLGRGQLVALQGAYFASSGVVLLAGSLVFHRVFERPILELKRYFVPRARARSFQA